MSELIRRPIQTITFTPVVTASSAYSAGNCVGTLFELKGAVLDGSGVALVRSILALSQGTSAAALALVLFSNKPAGTFTDKTAFNPSAADTLLITAYTTFGGTWHNFGTSSASSDIDRDIAAHVVAPDALNPGVSTSLWGILYTTGTPTFSTTSDLTVKISLEQY